MTKRINSIESLRFIAAFAIILIHYFDAQTDIKTIVDQWARFAVPFFFTISGYFLCEKLRQNNKPVVYWNYLKKVLLMYLCWQFIYFINPPFNEIYSLGLWPAYLNKFNHVFHESFEYILFHGWVFHLWFFMSLSLTVIMLFIFNIKRIYWMVALSILLYIFGVLAKAYAKTSIGIHVDFNTRNWVFFSALPFSLGVLMSAKSIRPNLFWSIIILLIGFGLHYTEIWYMGTLKLEQKMDYGFATFLMGLGVFLVGLNKFKPLAMNSVARLGKYSLGIYALHVLVASYLYEGLFIHFKPFPYFVYCTAIFVMSTLIAILLSKVPVIKKLVS